ncbi:hypothetical protein [Variovorax terrae]|uniref:Uncharacterized protein n=1 Tax=Variovorax terrae TaxID=2923278 RepID=A0A9X1VWX5_9BURK|nr:hypothetical protein [Variovorax terrae]MCJ0765331.1 hypothetical protein [Variovorax terrae]
MTTNTFTAEAGQTVTVVIEPAEFTPARAADLVDMFWSFVLALVIVWGAKQILNIFTSSPNGD